MASRPYLCVANLLACLFMMTMIMTMTITVADAQRPSYINYTTITGFFLQDDPTTDPSTFDYVSAPTVYEHEHEMSINMDMDTFFELKAADSIFRLPRISV